MPHSTEAHLRAPSPPLTERIPSWLRGRRGLVALAALVLSLGVAFNWSWLVAVGIGPLLLSVLPCLAMCALGLCMNRMAGSQDKASSASAQETDDASASLAVPRACCSSGHRDTTAVER
ncbi:hypothetical protein [Ensifer adhaerens]|uniref:DUF2933 domain-containing protein n=2 Tax=Sinorhizobium/Ensifer group TaxID=227292 RepID=A0A9Q8YIB4_ENSAD|nr:MULTISPECIES: hypothetical protein [Sinorhizobium/Ensifer group]USJ28662.1 hypothetical protein NE863_36005 [Ensifer adhaerens]